MEAATSELRLRRAFTPKQLEFLQAANDPTAEEVLFTGSIRGGKTQAACYQIFKWALTHGGTYLIARATYPELRDSTRKVFLQGDGGMPPTCPPELVESFNKVENVLLVKRPGGQPPGEIIFRAIQEHGLGKVRNITLAGVFIDQLEELDEGAAGEELYQELVGRLSDPAGPRKLLAAANPGTTTHWAYRRFVNAASREPQTRTVHVELADNAPWLPESYVVAMERTRETRPHWYRSRVRGEWGSFEGAAFEEFDERVHVVAPFAIPRHWDRFECMDFGSANPTAWYPVAVDYDGNLVVFDEYYSPGLVSEHAGAIRARREWWWATDDDDKPVRANCHADPTIANKLGNSNNRGSELSIEFEFQQNGFSFVHANNNRRAGYMRVSELLHPEDGRPAPIWASHLLKQGPTPRLFIFNSCTHLVDQLKSAPLKSEGQDALEVVGPEWESRHGHGVAALRYGCLSRPRPTPAEAEVKKLSPRAEFLQTYEARVNCPPGYVIVGR